MHRWRSEIHGDVGRLRCEEMVVWDAGMGALLLVSQRPHDDVAVYLCNRHAEIIVLSRKFVNEILIKGRRDIVGQLEASPNDKTSHILVCSKGS
jgi:hypothetical protein